MTRSATAALALLISSPALADDSSSWLDDAYSLVETTELELIQELVKETIEEVIEDVIGYESDQVMLAVCDDFVNTYEEEKEAEEEAAEKLNEAVEETIEDIVDSATDYYYGEHSLRNGEILSPMFPTDVAITSSYILPDTNGWICNYEAPPCGSYSEDDEETALWQRMNSVHGFESASPELRVCYQTLGTGFDAEMFVRTESDVECDGSYSVREQHVYIDDYDLTVVQDQSTTTETEVVASKKSNDSSTSTF